MQPQRFKGKAEKETEVNVWKKVRQRRTFDERKEMREDETVRDLSVTGRLSEKGIRKEV